MASGHGLLGVLAHDGKPRGKVGLEQTCSLSDTHMF